MEPIGNLPSQTANHEQPSSPHPLVCKADITRDDLTGLYLGQYALGSKIGGGGMGKVFRARHMHLDRLFAIKFVSAEFSGSDDVQERFEQETLALGRLQHPQIVNAVDAGCLDGLMYLVTEYIEGEDLASLVQRRGPILYEEACGLIRQAALGLAYSHASGFVHRDIKPSNLIVNRSGVVKILDFGLVRDTYADHQLTEQGAMLGTWDFLAPEQAHDSSQVDERCDLYSLGCTLLYLLSGQPPFSNAKYTTAASKLKGHLFDTPSWLEHPPANIPAELVTVVSRMLAKSPSQRYQTADEVAIALASFIPQSAESATHGITTKRRPSRRKLYASCAASIGLLGLMGWMASSNQPAGTGAELDKPQSGGTTISTEVTGQDEPSPRINVPAAVVERITLPGSPAKSAVSALRSFRDQRRQGSESAHSKARSAGDP